MTNDKEEVIASGIDIMNIEEKEEKKAEPISYGQYSSATGYKIGTAYKFCVCGHRLIGHYTTDVWVYFNGEKVANWKYRCMHPECQCREYREKMIEEGKVV